MANTWVFISWMAGRDGKSGVQSANAAFPHSTTYNLRAFFTSCLYMYILECPAIQFEESKGVMQERMREGSAIIWETDFKRADADRYDRSGYEGARNL